MRLGRGNKMNQSEWQTPLPHVLSFEGATNFRELGGYPGADGRRVKYGMLYRGGTTFDLKNDADRAVLEGLKLKCILDLRSTGEREAQPDVIPNGTDYLQLSAMRYEDGSEIDFSPAGMERLEREFSSMMQIRAQIDVFASFYARMPFGNPAFQAMFCVLEQGKVPMLFHCTSGKDRTGVAAMLILLALGADRETAVADYLETNRCRAAEIKALHEQYGDLIETNPEAWEMRLIRYGVLPRCADAALDAIVERYGDWETYFYEEFGLNRSRLSALRDRYLL